MKNLKISSLVLAGIVIFQFGCSPKLDNDTKKASYSIGQQIGQNLKQQNIEIDADVVAMALKDASKGDSKLSKEDQQKAMMKLQESVMKKAQEQGEKNKKTGQEFLDKNKTQPGVQVTKSGLQYQVLKEGTGKMPTAKDQVKCHYLGTLTTGEKFDSSYDRNEPATFPVSGVIPGWTEALQLMKVGSKWKLFIPSELAYGASPRPGIPANSVLVFEVELLDIVADNPSPANPHGAPKGQPKKK